MKGKVCLVRQALYALLMVGSAAVLLLILLSMPRATESAVYVPAAKPAEVQLLEGLPANHLLNSGDVNVLDSLPGVGAMLAQRIVEDRQTHGAFFFVEDLLTVSGIGEGKLNGIKEYLNTLNQP